MSAEAGEGRRLVYPFTAIVGQEKAKLALIVNAVDPSIGGVLLRGDKGTGKSTMVRAFANVLPEIEVVADCPFNCNPRNPLEMCDNCYRRYMRGEELPVARRKMRVVDLPLSVTIDRLVGTVDVERFLREGRKALQPGILAEANRNILYIDEVNLLDDYIVDAILDAAAMGWNIIEREGVSFRHPARFILVGSMNPEEGELRPQLLDRFGLVVDVQAPMDPEERAEIARRVEEFHSDPLGFYRKYESRERELAERIERARRILPKVQVSDDLLKLLAETVVRLGVKTLRAEIVTVKTAKAIAALDGRLKVTLQDLEKAMELALPHRLREKPFQKPNEPRIPPLQAAGGSGGGQGEGDPGNNPGNFRDPRSGGGAGGQGEQGGAGGGGGGSKEGTRGSGGLERTFQPGEADIGGVEARRLGLDSGFRAYRSSRDASITLIGLPRGVPVSYVPPPRGDVGDIDLYNSIVWGILNGRRPPVRLQPGDLRVRVRRAKAPTLWVVILDSSGSMVAQRRIEVAKGVTVKLIEEGYVKRSRIALIIARGREAELAVPPTRNYWRVLEAIEKAPTGGRTPLASALYKLLLLARRERLKEKSLKVRAFLVTDGKANVPLFGGRVRDELAWIGEELRRSGVELNIYDTRIGSIDPGLSYIDLLSEAANARVFKA
ncbi:ATP-binding protein [Stetteria hydrogenophila]